MHRARVVLDTNVLISRMLIPQSIAGRAVSRLLQHAQLLVSEGTLGELAQTLTRKKFDAYVTADDRQEFFRRFARVAEWVEVTSTVRLCRNSNDDKFLELAVDGNADWLVTARPRSARTLCVSQSRPSHAGRRAGAAGLCFYTAKHPCALRSRSIVEPSATTFENRLAVDKANSPAKWAQLSSPGEIPTFVPTRRRRSDDMQRDLLIQKPPRFAGFCCIHEIS